MTSNAYLYARLPPPFIFSFKHMACHVFIHEMSTFNNCHLFTNKQVLHHLLEITKYISQLANYGHIEKTRFFFKLLLILPIHKLATKRDTLFVTNSSIKTKVPHSFTTSRSARLYS